MRRNTARAWAGKNRGLYSKSQFCSSAVRVEARGAGGGGGGRELKGGGGSTIKMESSEEVVMAYRALTYGSHR